MKAAFLCSIILTFFRISILAQTNISIPAFTAYALPAENLNENDESVLFTKNGIENWTNTNQEIQFYFHLKNTGKLQLSLWLKTNGAGNQLKITVAGKTFFTTVPNSNFFKKVIIGTIDIKQLGFYKVVIQSQINRNTTIANIKSLDLYGTAVKNIHFNSKERRNAASVHLMYPIADSMKATSFYSEIIVPSNMDVLHSYYMVCGFARGYFGLQVNSPTERRIIFSVWDAGNEAVDRNKVNEDNKVALISKGENVFADGFGNEGTGGHSHWVYNWNSNITYKFLVTAVTDSATQSTTYAGYFFIPETQKWKLIACFKAPKDGKPLRNLYSFSENFEGNNGQLERKAFFGNQWIRRENGNWKEIVFSKFSYDATGKAGDRIDYGAGVENNNFYLTNGGFKISNIKYGDTLIREATNQKPEINFYKNEDSIIEFEKEKQIIAKYIDTTDKFKWKESNQVYYKIIKEGNGKQITLNDTLKVHYKGSLLNGFEFDASKDKPATFPLSRLIKGWQIGLQQCKEGGIIKLLIPSHLAYSIRNLGAIPPNSVLVFDIEVIGIK